MDDFNPQTSFIAGDGVEYACLADYLLGKPRQSYFNAQIQRYRELGTDDDTFRRKYAAFRESSSYNDSKAEGELFDFGVNFGYIAGVFYSFCNGPDDPTPITPSASYQHPEPDVPF